MAQSVIGKGLKETVLGSVIEIDTTNNTVTINDIIILGKHTTAQRDALNPVMAQVIYNTTTNKLNFYNGTSWQSVTSA